MRHLPSTVKTMALAVALALPAAPGFAASMSDIVTTRDDQDVHQQFGRDSVYALQNRQPAQTESRVSSTSGSSGVGGFFAGIGAAGASAWQSVTSAFEPGSHTVAIQEPRLYGRAGGYVGTDQLALLQRAGPGLDAIQPVTAGEAVAITAAERNVRYPAASESQLYGRDEDVFPQPTDSATSASEPLRSEQSVIASDNQDPLAVETRPEGQTYGRDSVAETPAAAPSESLTTDESAELTDQSAVGGANEATSLGRNEDQVYEPAGSIVNGPAATSDSQAPAADEAQLTGRNEEGLPEAAQATEQESATSPEVIHFDGAQFATDQAGAGEDAQSAPSPDSVTVLDEEKSRITGEQPGEASGSERNGRL
jgi:hypothetical protein